MSEFDDGYALVARPGLQVWFGDTIHHKPKNKRLHQVTAIIRYEGEEERDVDGNRVVMKMASIKVVSTDLVSYGRESRFMIANAIWGVDPDRKMMPEGSFQMIPLWRKSNIGLGAKGYRA